MVFSCSAIMYCILLGILCRCLFFFYFLGAALQTTPGIFLYVVKWKILDNPQHVFMKARASSLHFLY